MTRRNDEDWIGNATMLLSELVYDTETLKINIKSKFWPKGANSLSRRLKEIKVNLQQVGIDVQIDRDARQRIIKICKIPPLPSLASLDQNQARIEVLSSDATDTTSDIKNIASLNYDKNHAQNRTYDASDATLQTSKVKCPDCPEESEPYYMKFHTQNTGHRDWRE